MAYKCPRCGGNVSRGYSGATQMAAGLVGALFYAAFGSFRCAKCGKIPKDEFSQEDREKMTRGTVLLVVGGVIVLIASAILLSKMN
jgi:hypothetical protein